MLMLIGRCICVGACLCTPPPSALLLPADRPTDRPARLTDSCATTQQWDAAVAMHRFYQDREQFPLGCFQGKSVLELGSGTGLGTQVYIYMYMWLGLGKDDRPPSTYLIRPDRFGINLKPNHNQTMTVGITLTMLGARVVLTDLPEALDILQHNVDRCFTPGALAALR